MLMDFPADPPSSSEVTATQEQLAETLGLPSSKILNVEVSKKLQYVVIELDRSVDITAMKVDSGALVYPFKL
jgi:predicted PhzF superfamily epimerase YddE/YHI9